MSSSSSGSQYMMLSCECLCAHSISGHLFPSGKMMPSPVHLAMRSGGPPLGEKSTFISFPSDPGVRVAASRADEPETGVPTHTHIYKHTCTVSGHSLSFLCVDSLWIIIHRVSNTQDVTCSQTERKTHREIHTHGMPSSSTRTNHIPLLDVRLLIFPRNRHFVTIHLDHAVSIWMIWIPETSFERLRLRGSHHRFH